MGVVRKPGRARRLLDAERRRVKRNSPKLKVQRLMEYLEEKFKDPNFFNSLTKDNTIHTPNVRTKEFEGTTFAIKNTHGMVSHGFDAEKMRKDFLAHQMAIRKGELKATHYKLRSIKLLGKIGDYLVMQYIPIINIREMRANHQWAQSHVRAYGELAGNLLTLHNTGKIDRVPQYSDLRSTGNTNPSDVNKGKWVFYLPYDYG